MLTALDGQICNQDCVEGRRNHRNDGDRGCRQRAEHSGDQIGRLCDNPPWRRIHDRRRNQELWHRNQLPCATERTDRADTCHRAFAMSQSGAFENGAA